MKIYKKPQNDFQSEKILIKRKKLKKERKFQSHKQSLKDFQIYKNVLFFEIFCSRKLFKVMMKEYKNIE